MPIQTHLEYMTVCCDLEYVFDLTYGCLYIVQCHQFLLPGIATMHYTLLRVH
jgi:hypothetical protein